MSADQEPGTEPQGPTLPGADPGPDPAGEPRAKAEAEVEVSAERRIDERRIDDKSEPEVPREPPRDAVLAMERGSVASIVDGIDHAVHPDSILPPRLIGLALVTAIGGVALVPLSIVGLFSDAGMSVKMGLLTAWFALAAAFGWYAWKWPALQYRHLRYRVDSKGVRISRGVLWRKIISIPTTRVQHTDVTQGPLQRRFGLATLTVHTAGTQSASISLAGLSHQVALRLRDHLLPSDDNGV